MGISKVVSVNSALLLGLACTLRNRVPSFVLFPLLHSSVVGFLVAVSSHPIINNSRLFGKTNDGDFPWWSRLLFYPYMFPVRGYTFCKRKSRLEPLYSKVCEGIYVGGWPFLPEDVPPGEPAVIDCTCELPRSDCVRDLPYLCIPTWDTRGPCTDDIERAVRWASLKRLEKRPVFIHCASGHGRSVAVTCALLISLGLVGTLKDGEQMIQDSRPRARMNRLQIESLEKWMKQHKVQ